MAELTFTKGRSFKRKLMEVQVKGGGGGQMQRVHIVYYLSRNGRIEHPHLIRIHQVSLNRVHLRDVKSWLSELRGEDMPERFAWSYKRYKGGYVWQDLLDEDLITPICDNEYILKGSEISSTTLNNDISPYNDKEAFDLQKSPSFGVNVNSPKYPLPEKEYPLVFSTNTSIKMEGSSFSSNVTTENTTKTQDVYEDEEVVQSPTDKNENNSFDETLLDKKTDDNNNSNNNKNKKSGNKSVNSCFKTPPLPTYSFGKSGSFSGSRASHMFRNWITCGTASTNEKALVPINKRNGGRTSTVSGSVSENKENNLGQICKEQKLRGYEKSFDGMNGSRKSKKEESNKFKTPGVAYRPINGPNCSQCGRQFNPEKLHSHMKYCRGMKVLAKSASARPKPKPSSTHPASLETFYLTNN